MVKLMKNLYYHSFLGTLYFDEDNNYTIAIVAV